MPPTSSQLQILTLVHLSQTGGEETSEHNRHIKKHNCHNDMAKKVKRSIFASCTLNGSCHDLTTKPSDLHFQNQSSA